MKEKYIQAVEWLWKQKETEDMAFTNNIFVFNKTLNLKVSDMINIINNLDNKNLLSRTNNIDLPYIINKSKEKEWEKYIKELKEPQWWKISKKILGSKWSMLFYGWFLGLITTLILS